MLLLYTDGIKQNILNTNKTYFRTFLNNPMFSKIIQKAVRLIFISFLLFCEI